MTTKDTNGDVENGETSGSARENDGDFINKKAGVIKQVIRKINMILFMLSNIFCELNGLHQEILHTRCTMKRS